MKTLLYSLLTVCLFLHAPASFAINNIQAIGQVNDAGTTLVTDAGKVSKDLQHFLNTQLSTHVSFNHVRIEYDAASASYYLVATGTQGSKKIRSTIALKKYGHCLSVAGNTVICTSTETTGCLPVLNACTACPDGGSCTKTISAGTTIFPSILPGGCKL